MYRLQDELMRNPLRGKVVKGTGGARKIRLALPGKRKSGGARVIYYFADLRGEIWLLAIYAKSQKKDLNEKEKKKLYQFIKETINADK